MSKKLLQGKDLVVFYRNETKNPDAPAKMLEFQLDLTISREKQTEPATYKGGSVNINTGEEVSIDLASILYKTDGANLTTWRELEDIYDEDDILGLNVVDISGGIGEIEATYYQGILTTFEVSAPQDGQAELSSTYNVNGKPQRGSDTLTQEMLDSIQSMQYIYKKLEQSGEVAE